MRKTAVFVEGKAELILVREVVLRMHDYQNVGVNCYALINDNLNYAPYDYGCRDEENYYMIVNVGNDNSVLSKIKSRAENLCRQGYDSILGLRDVYGELYKKLNKNQRTINWSLIEKMMDASRQEVERMPVQDKVKFHFAVMEVEAWFLGLYRIFSEMDARLTVGFIRDSLGYDLEKDDPEHTYYHPAGVVGEVLGLVGLRYDKHEGDVSALISCLAKEDCITLMQSGKCASFSAFMQDLIA